MTIEVFLDERGAAFAALGSAKVTGAPAIVLCTSGTAATHFHAAVVEAHLSSVPMIVCTADRPPELRDVGAPQTIDQTALFGSAVRWFHDPGVAAYEAASSWRALADHVVARTVSPVPGPVHLNLPFREPLVGRVRDMPTTRDHDGPWSGHLHGRVTLTDWEIDDLAHRLVGRKGVIVAGDPGGGWALTAYASAATLLASVLDWPLLACPRSGTRVDGGNIVAHFDGIARSKSARGALAPEVVLRLGSPPASKVLGQWLRETTAEQIVVHSPGAYLDPDHVVEHHIEADVANTIDRLCSAASRVADERGSSAPADWSQSWRTAEAVAEAAIVSILDDDLDANAGRPCEPAIAREVAHVSPICVVSSSMPIRDVEWFASTGDGLLVYANRGANGIDGVTATAVGVASELGTATVYLGDIAFLHDSSSLALLANRRGTLRIVVVDNDGGSIFSFLPQAREVDADTFRVLFGTPHGLDLASVGAAFGVATAVATTVDELRASLARPGTTITVVRTGRTDNVEVHDRINAAIVGAVDAALSA